MSRFKCNRLELIVGRAAGAAGAAEGRRQAVRRRIPACLYQLNNDPPLEQACVGVLCSAVRATHGTDATSRLILIGVDLPSEMPELMLNKECLRLILSLIFRYCLVGD